MDERLEPCDPGLAEERALKESKDRRGQIDGRYRLKITFFRSSIEKCLSKCGGFHESMITLK